MEQELPDPERELPDPIHIIQDSRYVRQDNCNLDDISLCSSGNIAASGHRRFQSYVCIYSSSEENFDSRNEPTLLYHKQFEPKDRYWEKRCISFIKPNSTEIVTFRNHEVQVIDYNRDLVLRSRKVNGAPQCLSVSESQIFFGKLNPAIVCTYDNDLNRIKSIRLKGIRKDWPCDILAVADRLYVCTIEGRAIEYGQNSGNILTEYTTGQRNSTAKSIAVDTKLQFVAVLWDMKQISFYSFSDNTCLIHFNVETGVSTIRISGGRIVTGKKFSGEIKIYDLGSLLSYSYLKENLLSRLGEDDCKKLTDFFAMGGEELNIILSSERPAASFLLALEEKGVIQPSNVDKLEKVFHELKMSPSLYHTVALYKKLRDEITYYDKFLATLAAHLTSSVVAKLCHYFRIRDEQQRSIEASQNPGLSLLLVLDEMGVIKSSDVGSLEEPLHQLRLVQAVAKIHEYKEFLLEENRRLLRTDLYSSKDKTAMFVDLLKKKIKSWYETMTPVPWKKSCQWKSTDLFVGSGLILTDSKSKQNIRNIDEKCKLNYTEIFTHEKLKSEIRIKLEGDPGAGKTMLLSQLAYDWSKGNIDGVDILIFLPLKIFGNKTLIQAVKDFYIPMDMTVSEEDIEAILESSAETICLLLDGLEEYNTGKGKDETKESTEVMKIMKKQKHSNCKVVISTRSDFAHDLPECPSLKVGTFGELQRESYIKQLYADDTEKQQKIQSVIQDNSFLLDLCSVPLLFVLAVHNVENISLSEDTQLHKVSPFMRNMILTLCPADEVKHEIEEIPSEFNVSKKMTLGELAFNGLCKGHQQLAWPKVYMESNVLNFKLWVDSGILILEEGLITPKNQDQDVSHAIAFQGKEFSGPSASHDTPQSSTLPELSMTASGTPTDRTKESVTGQAHGSVSKIEKDQPGIKQKSAHQVPLVVKFLHKVIQEWFAATFFSSMMRRSSSKDEFQKYVTSQLQHIRPTDLHYILRFTSYLHPPSCHLIMNYLIRSYREDGSVPPYIMNCVFLCFNEHNGDKGPDMRNAVGDVCKEVITIQSEDSRLLQQAKAALVQYASNNGVTIEKLHLRDVICSVDETSLILGSGVQLGILYSLKLIELSRWDQVLQEEDYKNILKLLSAGNLLKEVSCIFPETPPKNLDEVTLRNIASKDITVKWHTGNYVHSLDPIKGTWMTDFKLPGSSLLKKKDVSENEGALQNDEEKRREITSSVPGSSKEFRKYLHTQGTLKRVGSDDGVKTVAVPEKKAKVVLEEPAKSDLTKGARERELRGVSKKSPNDRVEVLDFGEEAVASVVEQRHYAEEKTVKNVVHQFDQENSATVGESFNEDGSVQRVKWHIGNYVHSLDPIKGTWMTDFKLPGSSLLKKKDVSENEGALQNDEEKRREITSSVPGSSKEFRKYLHTQGTLKRVGSDDGVKTVAVPEKKAKVVLEEPAKSDLTKGARERELRGVSKKSPNDRVEVLDFGEEAVASVVEQRHYAEEKTVKNVVHQFDQENSATVGESFNEDGSVQRVAFDEHSLMSSPGTSKSSTSKGLVEGHLEEHSAYTSPREVDTEFPLLETEATLTFDRQQTVTITGTKVELTIPPYALSEDMDKSKVKLRIIPRLNFENPCKGFSSNSAVIVEILPNNTRLKQPAKLRIPHCLLLEENRQHEAKIYMSHHQEGDAPQWEEQFHLSYIVEERSCILFLDKFCWVTMTVGDRNVLGKRVLFYASGKSLDPRRQCAEVAVGYYHNLDGEGEFLQHNKSIVSTKMPYTFLKEGARPLSLRVIQYSSDQWELWPSDETSKVVPFEAIDSPFDYTWTLLFKKQMMHSSDLKCKFKALQEQGQHPIELKICLEPLGEGVLEPKNVSECKTMEEKMRTCFLLLKGKLLKTDWKDFGRYLDVQEQHLYVEEGDVSESIYQMLLNWQRTNGIKASPKNLKDALIKVGRNDLIEKVNKIFS